jgi:phosphoglycerol transferase MdoB-like AlkP superfamily enzyme
LEKTAQTNKTPRQFRRRYSAHWRTALSVAIVLAVLLFSALTEIRVIGFMVTVLTFVTLASAFRLLAIGPLASTSYAFICILAIHFASKFKFWLTSKRLHPYDIHTYVDWDTVAYLKVLYPSHYLYFYGLLLLVAIVVVALLLLDGFRRPSRWAFALFAACILAFSTLYTATLDREGELLGDGNRFMHFDHQHVSTFVISGLVSAHQLASGNVFDYGDQRSAASQASVVSNEKCEVLNRSAAPNVILILRESAAPLAAVEELHVNVLPKEAFLSSNDKFYQMRVETHGAGSAYTIFNVLTGLSSEAFGGMKNMAIDLATKHVHLGLAGQFRDCGYKTVAITTGQDGYIAGKEFYHSLGFQEYLDIYDIGKQTAGIFDDHAIYDVVLRTVGENAATPTFVYVDTVASHGPYVDKLRADEDVGVEPSGNPEIDEYARRILLGEKDLNGMIKKLESQLATNQRPALVVDFGDHQPNITKDLPGLPGHVDEDIAKDDPLLLTYFRMRTIGMSLPRLPDHPRIDAAFLPDWLWKATQLPTVGMGAARWSTVERCSSRYWQCDGGNSARELHRLLRDQKLISFP